ncbi:cytochrome P450 [Desarmillaria tabescens]|uniref:Cytochrome P450 n=1 Tax=Armillaria tabescens TaxID=1929756 RepID=A0AA39N2B3_ARMTA|nr:cytochrome P450 [Desarmillaria tabescens]KAK0455342.1 cytochrome P450 [Desarmillaria tabescens]
MQSTSYYVFPAVAILLTFVLFLRSKGRRSLVQRIRGPLSPSFLLGHEYLLRNRQHVGDMETQWCQEYGAVYRTKGCFGQNILSVADPKALQYIFHSSGYRFRKTRDSYRALQAMAGQGLVGVDGIGNEEKISERVGDAKELNMLEWGAKTTLDIIGITSFRYQFNSLGDGNTKLMAAVNNLFSEAARSPTSLELLYPALWRLLPGWLLIPLGWIPSRQISRLNFFKNVAMKVSRPIFEKQLKEVAGDVDPAEKDIVNVLAISYLNDDVKKKMSDIEIDSQLALHPEDQRKIREEITQIKANTPGTLTSDDYDSMLWLNASIKEALRLHPLAYGLFRESSQDDVLPLAQPITTSDGQLCSQIPIRKGQVILTSVYSYNRAGLLIGDATRLPSVWGDDAEEWNPSRFLDNRDTKQLSVGVYANLLTFSAGIRGCIGWRFAVMELQSVVTELLSNFEFSMPKGAPRLQHGPAGQTLGPIVLGKAEEGPQIPLLVTPLNR